MAVVPVSVPRQVQFSQSSVRFKGVSNARGLSQELLALAFLKLFSGEPLGLLRRWFTLLQLDVVVGFRAVENNLSRQTSQGNSHLNNSRVVNVLRSSTSARSSVISNSFGTVRLPAVRLFYPQLAHVWYTIPLGVAPRAVDASEDERCRLFR